MYNHYIVQTCSSRSAIHQTHEPNPTNNVVDIVLCVVKKQNVIIKECTVTALNKTKKNMFRNVFTQHIQYNLMNAKNQPQTVSNMKKVWCRKFNNVQ